MTPVAFVPVRVREEPLESGKPLKPGMDAAGAARPHGRVHAKHDDKARIPCSTVASGMDC
jgi:hypothetical protein